MDAVARGEDPLGTIREPHERIDLPCEKDKFNARRPVRARLLRHGLDPVLPVLDTIKKMHISAGSDAAVSTGRGDRSPVLTRAEAGSRPTPRRIGGTRRASAPPVRPWPAEGGRGLAMEFWLADDRGFYCYCGGCGWTGEIALSERVMGHEAAE